MTDTRPHFEFEYRMSLKCYFHLVYREGILISVKWCKYAEAMQCSSFHKDTFTYEFDALIIKGTYKLHNTNKYINTFLKRATLCIIYAEQTGKLLSTGSLTLTICIKYKNSSQKRTSIWADGWWCRCLLYR